RCKFHHTTSRRFAFAFKRYRREATWSTMVSLLNAASLLAPVLLLSQFYPIREIGWYALMTSLAISPMSIFSAAIGQSFWSEAARLARTRKIGRLRALYLRTTKRLATASLVVVAICASGPFFVGPLFGKEDWGGAGHVLVALTPMLVGAIIFSPTNHLIVLSRQSTQMFADAGRLALVIVAILVSQYAALEFVFAVALTALASFCGHFGLFLLHLRAH